MHVERLGALQRLGFPCWVGDGLGYALPRSVLLTLCWPLGFGETLGDLGADVEAPGVLSLRDEFGGELGALLEEGFEEVGFACAVDDLGERVRDGGGEIARHYAPCCQCR